MNMKKIIGLGPRATLHAFPASRVIATFGAARLVRTADGRHELLGGTAEDSRQAREWCSLFAPEVVFPPATRTPRILTLTA